MMLLDYIEVVRRPESKIDEISGQIDSLRVKMEYLMDVKIMLQGEAF